MQSDVGVWGCHRALCFPHALSQWSLGLWSFVPLTPTSQEDQAHPAAWKVQPVGPPGSFPLRSRSASLLWDCRLGSGSATSKPPTGGMAVGQGHPWVSAVQGQRIWLGPAAPGGRGERQAGEASAQME